MCGVFGLFVNDVSSLPGDPLQVAADGLRLQQHRGQAAAGISYSDDKCLRCVKGLGNITDVVTPQFLRSWGRYSMKWVIGHVRYPTVGDRTGTERGRMNRVLSSQPILSRWNEDLNAPSVGPNTLVQVGANGCVAVSHNGHFEGLEHHKTFAINDRETVSDTDLFAKLLHPLTGDIRSRFNRVYLDYLESENVSGSYSLVLADRESMLVVRDPNGFHPLAIGTLGSNFVVASETFVLRILGCTSIRSLFPGEALLLHDGSIQSSFFGSTQPSFCVFEYVYLARPDTELDGIEAGAARRSCGARLAEEHPVKADVVVGVPDSGLHAAIGFAWSSDIPFDLGLVRSHYVDRTFIDSSDKNREHELRLKFSGLRSAVEGKRVVVVDDSVVRGSTVRVLLSVLRELGATEIHLRVASPPVTNPCYYGVDIRTPGELLGACCSSDNPLNEYTSVGYLSVEGMESAINKSIALCDACFTGEYPV